MKNCEYLKFKEEYLNLFCSGRTAQMVDFFYKMIKILGAEAIKDKFLDEITYEIHQ